VPNKRLPYIVSGYLNTANSSGPSGIVEPITGLPLPSSIVPGDSFQLTDAEALALSKTSVGTLYSGRYMWALIDPAAVSLKRGQLLWLLAGGASPYEFTNVEPANAAPPAAILINSDAGGAYPVTAGQYCYVQLIAGGVGSILFKTPLTGPAAVGVAVYAAGAGVGAQNATADVLDGAGAATYSDVTNADARLVGVAKALPVAAAISTVTLQNRYGGEL
jgi:hypothetical protein